MNPDQPSRQEIEAKLTALLLGELSDEEARLLRWAVAQDAGLKKLHDQLQVTIGFVREAEKNPATTPGENVPLKLSDERRQKLLAHFQTPRPQAPKELFWLKRIEIRPLVVALALVVVVALLAAIALPNFVKARNTAMRTTQSDRAELREIQPLSGDSAYIPPSVPPAAAITPSLEPKLALPPTEIVLPKPDSTPDPGAQGTFADVGNIAVLSRRIVGYNNVVLSPAPATTPSTLTVAEAVEPSSQSDAKENQHPVDTQKRMEQVEKQWVENNHATDQAQGAKMSGDTFAARLNNVISSPANANVFGLGGKTESQPAGVVNVNGLADPSGSGGRSGGGGFGGFGGGASSSGTMSLKPAENASTTLEKGLEEETHLAYANPSDISESLRKLNQTANNGGDFNGDAGVAQNRTGSGERFYRNLGDESGAAKPGFESFDGSINSPVVSPAVPNELSKSGGGALMLNGGNTYSGGTTVNNGTLAFDDSESTRAKTAGRSDQLSLDVVKLGIAKPSDHDQDVSVIGPKNADPQQVAEELKNMFAAGSSPAANSSSQNSVLMQRAQNAASVTVFEDQMAREKLAATKFEDQSGSNLHQDYFRLRTPIAVQITNAIAMNSGTANDLFFYNSGQLNRSLGVDQNGTAGPATVTVDPATHNLVVVADKATSAQIREIIGQLEVPVSAANPLSAFPATTPPGDAAQLAATKFSVDPSKFYSGLTRDDVSGLKYLLLENSNIAWESAPAASPAPAQSGAVVGVVNAFSGAGGLNYITQNPLAGSKNEEARNFISSLGVNLQSPPGKAVFYNDRLGKLFVKATEQDLDTIERAIAPNSTSSANSETDKLAKANVNDLRMRAFSFTAGTNLPAVATLVNDRPIPKAPSSAPVPQPEILCRENNFSTFSLNVSDVSFKLAAANLEKGRLPDAASIRSEEFINAFDYRDPEAAAGQPLAFAAERARYPFAHNRDLLRFSVKTAAAGRPAGRALNLVLLLDTSGSMERADRVAIIREALRVLAAQLQPQDTVSVVTFARTARLWADGVPGDKAGETLSQVGGITPEGGTNLEEAMRLAYETARRHYLAGGMNRVALLTDGAANLGNVDPGALKQKVEAQRRQGIALDCFGIGWEDFNDDLLEQLSGNGDGRYAFINSPEDAANDFAAKLAGALQVAAQDVKVQVEFNPQRVISWRQIGYAKHQLTKEQFRDNSVIAAEIAAQEAGNALYTVETKPDGIGPIATVRVRYRTPGTQDFYERSWNVDYTGNAPSLEQGSPAMRLAATAAAFSEWLAASPFAQEVTPDELLKDLSSVPQIYGADQRPAKLETMIREAKSIAGK
jgi:autotransporter-associated beta strand protein